MEATEEDMRKSEEINKKPREEGEPARVVFMFDNPVPPAIGEKQAEDGLPADQEYEERIMPRSFWYSLDMFYYGQKKEPSCGPACVRMVLRYFTGNSYEEETICQNTGYSDLTGTRLGDLVEYINAELDREEYRTYFKETEERMRDSIYNAIKVNARPVIIGVVPGKMEGSPYNGSNGHFLVVYGCKSDKTSVAIMDPWAGYKGDSEEYYCYLLPMESLYAGYEAINSGFAD